MICLAFLGKIKNSGENRKCKVAQMAENRCPRRESGSAGCKTGKEPSKICSRKAR